MIFKKLLKGEILEFDIFSLIKKNKTSLIYLIFLRIYHLLYKKFQRLLLKPKQRRIFQKIEKFIFTNKNKNSNQTNKDIIKKNSELKKNNFIFFEEIFEKNEIKNLQVKFKNEKNLIDVYTDNKNFSCQKRPISARMGYIPTEHIFNDEIVLKAANNKNLVSLLDNYFNCKYSLDWAWAWWSFESKEKDHGPQNFHRDYESLNFIKVFVYLTDVINNDDGCHEFVLSSSYINQFYKRKRFDQNYIKNKFKNNVIKIFGKAGTTFIVDTYGIHRGVKPKAKDRLVLSLLYSVFPSNRSPKIPPLNFSELNNKNLYKKNKYLNRLFINFDR